MSRSFAQDAPINYWAGFFRDFGKAKCRFSRLAFEPRTHLPKSNIDVTGSGLVSQTLFFNVSVNETKERGGEKNTSSIRIGEIIIEYSLNLK